MSKNLVRTSHFPYHIVARANNKRPFPVELDWLWMKMVDALNFATWAYGFKVHSFVLMPNHFHLIASTKGDDLGVVMNFFMREIAIQTNLRAGQINRMWGGRYKWSVVDCERYLGAVVRYVYRNPVRAKLCHHVLDYPYSTLVGLCGQGPHQIQLHPFEHQNIIPEDPMQLFCLVDGELSHEASMAIRSALRKKKFAVSRRLEKCLIKEIMMH